MGNGELSTRRRGQPTAVNRREKRRGRVIILHQYVASLPATVLTSICVHYPLFHHISRIHLVPCTFLVGKLRYRHVCNALRRATQCSSLEQRVFSVPTVHSYIRTLASLPLVRACCCTCTAELLRERVSWFCVCRREKSRSDHCNMPRVPTSHVH